MKHSIKVGLSFGLTSGIVTTLGLIIGLNSSTHLKSVVIGGIFIIAMADALSDAMGIHLSEESEGKHSAKEIWESTISTFVAKFIFALTFVAPILVFSLPTAIVVSIIWGLFLLAIFSFWIAKEQKVVPWKVITEHLLIALAVIVITRFIGNWVSSIFG